MQEIQLQSYLFDSFTLDLARGRLLREGEEVKLRPKSFEALTYLVRNSGRLVSKEELIQQLWPDSFVTDGSLVQCLRDVRLALGDESQQMIKTVPRRGYIFETQVTQPPRTERASYARQVDRVPETRYAKSGDINIAYQVMGTGPIDLIYVPGWVSHLEYSWEEPSLARFYRNLASFSRLILFDKRGTGLSDQSTNVPTLEQRMDDVRAVMDAVDSQRAVVFGMSEGGNMAMLFAATYPERTIALITFGVFAKRVYDSEYPWAPTPEERQSFYDAIERDWGGPIGVEDLAPSMAHDEHFRRWWASYQRRSASPRAALALAKLNTLIDVRHILPAIRVPTLVMHRADDHDSNIEEGRYVASKIRGAKFIELPGQDHLLFVGDQNSVLREIETFVSDIRNTSDVDSVLATVLYIEASLKTAEDNQTQGAWNRFHALAKREAEWFKGRVGQANENEFCAIFDGPIRAIRCAKAIRDGAIELEMDTKSGLHTGLCEMRGDQAAGTPVEISKRVVAQAAPGEVLVTNTVMDLVSGSVVVSERGACSIEGLAGDCRLFATP